MKLIETKISVGAAEHLELLHISDTHLTLADDRDDERKLKLADERAKSFPHAEEYLAEAEEYAAERDMTIVHTGDLIDFVSEANLDRAREFCENNDVFFAAGNHEFSLYVGEAFEDAEYRNQSLSHVQESFTNDIRFDVRKINGVNIVALDNSYYLFEEYQLEGLKEVAAEGLPMILLMHNPLYAPDIYEEAMSRGSIAYLTGVPTELMTGYDDYRLRQQTADDITLETIEYIKSEPLIKAIFTGHVHYDFESELTPSLKQYATGIGSARVISIE